MNPTCSIIIPHYEQVDWLSDCLASLVTQNYDKAFEILVIDNGTEPLSLTPLKEKYGQVMWLEQHQLRNPYVSRNRGIEMSQSDILLFLDAKCRPHREWLPHMMEAHRDNPDDIIAGSYQLTYPSEAMKDKVFGLLYLNNEKNVQNRYGVTTGNLLVPRSVFKKVGVFDTSHVSGRDIQWSKRAMTAGVDIHYEKNAIVNYPSQAWEVLIEKVKKYGHGTPKDDQTASLNKSLLELLPLKMSTFSHALANRGLTQLSVIQKIELWLRTWFIKVKYYWYKGKT